MGPVRSPSSPPALADPTRRRCRSWIPSIQDIPIEGAPGDVVQVDFDLISVKLAFASINARVFCESDGEAESLGSVVVSGTTVSVDGTQPFEEGKMVPLKAEVFPSSATGIVQFFDGDESIGFAPVSAGVAQLNAIGLDEGTHSVTAKYLGGLAQPPSTSAAVEVVVRDAIQCADFTDDGDGAVVRLVYLELLERCPDEDGYDYWVDQLDGGTSPEVFARQISNTEEARKVVADDGYQTILDRDGSDEELTFWAGYLRTHRYDTMLAAIGNSPEYWAASGSTNNGFVTRTYQRLLERDPEPAGLTYWVGRLPAGEGRYVMLRAPSPGCGSQRCTSWTSPSTEILDRSPTAEELDTQLGLYQANGNRSAIYGRLMGTQEFIDPGAGLPN